MDPWDIQAHAQRTLSKQYAGKPAWMFETRFVHAADPTVYGRGSRRAQGLYIT